MKNTRYPIPRPRLPHSLRTEGWWLLPSQQLKPRHDTLFVPIAPAQRFNRIHQA